MVNRGYRMRLYHTILVLSAVLIAITAAFQAAWMFQFSHLRDSLTAFEDNWMPSVRASSSLIRLTGEHRRLEMLCVLSKSEGELTHAARHMNRQLDRITQVENGFSHLLQTQPEQEAFGAYLADKAVYIAYNREMLASMGTFQTAEALDIIRASAHVFTAMADNLQLIEQINQQYGRRAEAEASQRYSTVVRTMAASGAANILIALAAAFLAARRISRPIARLADCMTGGDAQSPRCIPPDPRAAVYEVSALYTAFRTLTANLAATMARLETIAVTDQLTGLANRRRLMDEGARVLAVSSRGRRPCSALMLDLDHFKAVNDTHGHAAGDAVLAGVAATLRANVRESDILARYGGEEFAVLAPDTGLEDVRLLAERLRLAVSETPVDAGTQQLRVTISIGAAATFPPVPTLDGLLARADKALYRAKAKGRNRVETSRGQG